jgi:hypothetical protein
MRVSQCDLLRPAFDHQAGEQQLPSNSGQTPAEQVVHHRRFIVATVRGPKRLINCTAWRMHIVVGQIT